MAAFGYPVKESCPHLFAVSNVQSSLFSVRFYRMSDKTTVTFHSLYVSYSLLLTLTWKLPSVPKKAHARISRVAESLRARSLKNVVLSVVAAQTAFPLSRRKRLTCSGERAVGLRGRERWRTNGSQWKKSLLMLLPLLAPSAAHRGRENNVHGAQIQSPVMQKS